MKEALSWLDIIDEQIVDTYVARTGRPRGTIMKEMVGKFLDGTQFDAAGALAGKYVDKIMPLKRGAAAAESKFNLVAMKGDGEKRLRNMTDKAFSPATIAAAKRQDKRQFLIK